MVQNKLPKKIFSGNCSIISHGNHSAHKLMDARGRFVTLFCVRYLLNAATLSCATKLAVTPSLCSVTHRVCKPEARCRCLG